MKALFVLLLASGSALADDAALRHCRTINDVPARVACYDAIPVAPVRTPDQDFGIETVKKTVEAPKSIATTIPGRFDGWQPGQTIKLANGQSWRIVDGSQAVLAPLQDPKVTIERNAFGTMFLKIEGTNQTPKVRRIN